MYRGFRGLTFFSRVGKGLYLLSTIEMYHKQQFVSHLSNFDTRKACLSLEIPSPPIKFVKLKIGARRHEANEWLTSSKIPQFQGQVFSTADAHIAYWCHNSKSSECRDLHTGLSSMSPVSSPERGRCVPNTSQTVRSRWKRAFPSWSVRFAYTACKHGLIDTHMHVQWRYFFYFYFFIVHRKRIHRAHIRHNLIQSTHCYVNTYHNGYTIHVLPNFLYIHIYIHTYIHTLMYRHLHVSTYTYTHIYIFKPEVFFLANENIVHKTRMQKIWFTFGLVIYIFYHIF